MAATTPSALHFFGIRHHGPGSARSLLRAFEALQPDCVLVEGPPEAEPQLAVLAHEGMHPPVALLSYCPDDTGLAVYHPFAEFSPEWQALGWAVRRQVPARFIDLPLVHAMGLEKARREAPAEPAATADAEISGADEAASTEPRPVAVPAQACETDDGAAGEADEAGAPQAPAWEADPGDPLDALARAAGHADGESWWNHMVEERGDGEELFAAIAEAMAAVRADFESRHPELASDAHPSGRHEALREAHMRQCVREALKQGFQRIAVVVGAWHLRALTDLSSHPVRADQQRLKGLPRVKVACTWVPWTYRHLARTSGYGAGIRSPGWYEHLWRSSASAQARSASGRTIGWLARVARLLRERDLDCSSAHLIEAARLAESLAALREQPQPGLEELNEAVRTVLCMGDDAALRLIEEALVVGDRLGAVPPDVPTVPLQRDLEQAQKSLRLKPEAFHRTLDLDLRQPNDLARSHLLHRLRLLGIGWGEIARQGRSSRGTFHEVWNLQWQPEFMLQLIEASRWGQTVVQAATARVIERAGEADSLAELASLVDEVLLAQLPQAVEPVTQALENRAARTGDALQLMAALPPLAQVFRYGSVRQTDTALVGHVLDSIIVRAAIGLPLACGALDDAAAETLRGQIVAAHGAVALRAAEAQTEAWQRALRQMAAGGSAHELLAGLASRLLLDDGAIETGQAAQALGLHLSAGNDPAKAAAWLEGFLNRNALVLLHDATVWGLIDAWLASLSDEHFLRVLPLVRRTFSAFAAGERRELGLKARQGAGSAGVSGGPAPLPAWDEARAALPVPALRRWMGLQA